jgi:serine/threonine protein kinase
MNSPDDATRAPPSARSGPRAGQVIGESYRLEELLERGAMGSVWRAEQIRLRAPAAIKFLDPTLIGDPEMRNRFMQEARSAASVRSANVVQIFDYGSDGNVPYIAMELLEGEDLGTRLSSRGTLKPAELNKIFREVARGIGQAHAMGVVHRDVKTGNIFIVREGEHEVTKLIDFGIAKVKADALKFTQIVGTQLGTLLGTPQYMSPEQVRGSATLDHRTDLWALAIIACECLTGRYPFPGTSIGDLAVQICTERPRAPSMLGHVPSGFDQWFFKGTSKKPGQRFSSVEEMADALDKILLASGANAAPSTSSRWRLGRITRLGVRRVWIAASRRLAPLSALAKQTLGGWGDRIATFAPRIRSGTFHGAIPGRFSVRWLVSSRTGFLVSAMLIAILTAAILWLPRRGAPEQGFREEPAQAIQAASPEPAAANLPPLAAAPPADEPSAPAAPVPGDDLISPSAPAADAVPEPVEAASVRRSGKRQRTPSPDTATTPFGPMSIAMGQAGARIASGDSRPTGDSKRAGARSSAAASARPRPQVKKAPDGSRLTPESEPRRD